jgi:CRP-like cAMP-binding protein
MIEQSLVRSSTQGGSPRRTTKGIASLQSLATTPSALVRVDPRAQEELAKMICSTRESVTHVLADLRRRGVLAVAEGRMIILNPAGLALVAGTYKDTRGKTIGRRIG